MKTFVIGAAALVFSMVGAAQKLNLDFPNLAAQAKEKAEVNLDRAALAALGQKPETKNCGSQKVCDTISSDDFRCRDFLFSGLAGNPTAAWGFAGGSALGGRMLNLW